VGLGRAQSRAAPGYSFATPHLEAYCMQVLLPKTVKQEHQVVTPRPVIHVHEPVGG